MQEVNEAATDIAASAKAGLEKTMAVVEEKIEKLMTNDPVRIQAAEEKKNTRIHEAERLRQETMAQNQAAHRASASGLQSHSAEVPVAKHNDTTGVTSEAEGSQVTGETKTPSGPTEVGGAK